MKKLITLLIVSVTLFSSCRKDYNCVCTDTTNGQRVVVDQYKTFRVDKKIVEKSCDNDNSSSYKDCQVEQ